MQYRDTVTDLRFNVPLDTKQVISEVLFQHNLLAGTDKKKLKLKSGKNITI